MLFFTVKTESIGEMTHELLQISVFLKKLSNSQMQFASLYKVARAGTGCRKTNGGRFSSFFFLFFSIYLVHGFFESLEFSYCGFLLGCVGLLCYAEVMLLKISEVYGKLGCLVLVLLLDFGWFCCWILDGLLFTFCMFR